MANFRTTADLVDGVLRRCGEITSDVGVSPRTNQALLYLNQIHHNVISGGCELEIDIDESWPWAKARRPIIVNLATAVSSGSCSLSYKAVTGSFSVAPVDPVGTAISVQGWFLRPTTGPEVYQVTTHTAGQTAFSIDSAYQQSTNASLSFNLFKLDYDLITQYIIVDTRNTALDFIENSTTNAVLSAQIPAGSYTPTGYATAVATALNAATTIGGNVYSCAYNATGTTLTGNRTFTVSCTTTATNAVFQPQGASPNSYRSAWSDALGFDVTNYIGALTYTGIYPLSFVTKLTQPARIYYGTNFWYSNKVGQMSLLDPVRFDRDYPMVNIQAGTPECFSIIRELSDGTQTIRTNRYAWATTNVQGMRAEFDYVAEPRDLYNNAYSVPLIPRKYIRILEYGAAYYLLKDKSDQKSEDYLAIAQKTLVAMMKDNRKQLEKAGRNFGNVVARADLTTDNRYYRPNTYGYDSAE